MKFNYKNICKLFIPLFFFCFSAHAQNIDTLRKSTIITINSTQLLFNEIQITFEKFLNKGNSIEIGLGYKIPRKVNKIETLNYEYPSFSYEMELPFINFSKSYYACLTYKTYLRRSLLRSQFLSLSAFYRYYDFDNQIIYHISGDNGTIYYDSLSTRQYNTGLKLMTGKRILVFSFSEKLNCIFDVFYGLGLRVKSTRNVHYGQAEARPYYTSDAMKFYPNPVTNSNVAFTTSAHFGINIGLQWK